MKSSIFHHRSTIASASLILAGSALLSRLLGLFRDRLLAGYFGTGSLVDAYQISFLLPDFVYNIFIIGALSASFIPVFLALYAKDKKQAWDLTSRLFNLLAVSIIIILAFCFLFTPQLVSILGKIAAATGSQYDAANLNLIVRLTRLMLLSPLILAISSLATNVLQSLKHFLAPAISPLLYNLGIIFGILFLAPSWGIYGVAWGVIFGAVLHLLVQLPGLYNARFRYCFSWKITSEVWKVIKLSLPRTFGLAAAQANLWINKIIAFTLGAGAVSVYYFANNLQFVPIGLFGVSLAVATFPDLAKSTNGKNKKEFIQTFSRSFRQIIYLTVPASIIFLLLRAQIVRIILGTGAFDWQATILTARTLGFFAISIFAQSLVMLLARAFYALQDSKTPVLISIVTLAVNIILALILAPSLGVAGLALAYSAANFINLLVLIFVLRLKLENLDDLNIIKSSLKIILASFLMGAATYASLHIIAPLVNMHKFWGIFIQASSAALIGISVYILCTWALKSDEIHLIAGKMKHWKNKILIT